MRDLDNINSCKSLKNEVTYFNEENRQSHGENVNIIIVTRKRLKNRKKHNVFIQAQQHRVLSRLSRFSRSKEQVSITRHSSMPELNEYTWPTPPRNRSGRGKDTIQNKYQLSPYRSRFIDSVVSEQRFDERLNLFGYPRQTKLKIYRCEVGGTEDNCCCSCNSDAMFEIMKSLYDCYKKRDCTNCTCILCSHLKPEDKLKFSEKEKELREQAMKGLPLPEGKTSSEKQLINKVRTDLGVPIEPTTKEIRDKHEEASKAGKLLPLEGKTPTEKEKILQDLFDMGIPLPKGRTPSEKALIAKISGKALSEVVSVALAPSEQMRKAKAEGLLTPLKGKTPEEREKILKGLAMIGLPLPEGQTPSENKLIDKVRTDLGLPIEPKNKDIRDKHEKAAKAGKLQPLEGKTPEQKEKILKGLHNMGIPLPVGRTPSEKSLIAKIAASPRGSSKASSVAFAPSEQMRRAKAEGLLTPLKGKTPKQREKILRGLAMKGLPLPEAQSPSEKKLIKKVRADLGLPKDPTTKSMKDKHEKAGKAGLLQPLEGKTPKQKEKTLKGLRDLGIPLPEGRTPSEKALIEKVKASPPSIIAPSEQLRRAKLEGLLTPLKGKSPEQKENIVKGLAMKGLPLPEAESPSEKKLIDKVRADLGLPKDPTTKSMKERHEQAAKAGLLQPLEGKTPAEKARVLKGLRDLGIPLPEGRTPSEKALIDKVKASPRSIIAPSEQLRRAKAEGLLTPLKGKPPEQKEKILRGLAMKGLALPEAQSPSEKKLIDKVRADLGLPKDPTTKSMKDKHEQAAKAGLLQPLEGKTPEEKARVLKGLRDLGIPLPEGRTPSEKALIGKVKESPRSVIAPSEQLRRAKAEGLLTALKGKSPEQKEKIVKGLAMKGLPLPEAQSPSEKKLIDKIRADLGLPKDPTTKSMKDKHEQAAKAGLLQPLEGKTPAEKAKVLKGLRDLGIPLPEGRTPSEKALIEKVKASPRSVIAPSEQLRRAKAEGLLTPLKGKTPEQKEKILKGLAMKGLALPEAQSPSEKKLIDKVRADLGLPKDPTTKSMKDRHEQAAKAGLLQPLEGKTPAEKAKVLKGLRDLGIPLPEGRTPSEKALIGKVKESPRSVIAISEQLRRAKAEGLLTALKGKPPEQKEKIVKGLAMKGLPLPEAQSPSEKKLIDKVRADLGLPKDPTTKSMKHKHEQAAKAGLLQPLEGKTPAEKAKVLKGLRDLGIPLPEGRTPSEKALIGKIKESPRSVIAPSEQLRRAKAEGLLTPLKGKPPEQKEKILKGLAMKGLALPEAQSPSEKKLIDKVRADLGLPKDPTTKSMKDRHEQAAKAGLLQPLEGKTPAEKAKVLKGLRDLGIPLPEGRTPSEKALIGKIKESPRSVIAISEQLRRAKAEGLLTALKGKPPEQKEKIVKGLAMKGLPLPEAQSPSEKKLIDKVRADLGLPKDPTTKSMKDRHEQAAKAGLLQPLEGKTPAEKARVLKGLRDLGIPLPEGRTPSEKALIEKVKASPRSVIAPSEQLRRAKAEGLLTPLKGKPPEQKEKILKGLAMKGLALPEAESPSEKELIDKVRVDLGLPKDPTTKSMKEKHAQAAKAGLLQPLEGKTPAEKARVLKGLRDLGIPLPEGRTPSEKALIEKVKASPRSVIAPSEQLRRAKAEGLLTPLKGKPPEQKEKILKGLAMKGLALPEAESPSEKELIDKVRVDLGLPKDPTTKSMKEKHAQAAKAGLLQPLEGKSPAEKARVLKGLRDLGIPLPKGRTPSEKALIEKVKASPRSVISPSEQLRRAKAEGLLTPLKGKPPEQKEKILKGLAMKGLALPDAESPSEKKLIDKVRVDLGLPKDPTTKSMKEKHKQAAKAGLLQPLEGKTTAEKAKVLKGLRDLGIPLPEGRTPSEKALIAKVKASSRSVLALSEQLRRAKAEGLLTPLKGKTPEEREKILKGLAMKGLPLPEGQTPSENKLIDKVRTDLGLPIEPKNKDIRDKHEKAAKAGKLLPLEGKTPAQKEKILKGLHNMGIPLPIGRTPSEKSLIAKIAAGPRGPSKAATATLSPSEQLRTAKAEGLLTPLKGKTPEEREKILKGLAMKGLPLPEGQTPSENKLIDKVRTDLGLPIEPKNKDIRDKHEKAAKAGKLLSLEGKTPEQKEKILKGLHDMGIPLPIGRTPSEKALIAKVMAGPSAAIGVSASKKAAGIAEEYEEIEKTTKCDRGCGCDKKKIRFKHSYVKIKVTSPDISSFCDCPGICIPGVKSGVFIDSDGIKVTVARALGIPSFTAEYKNHITHDEFSSKRNCSHSHTEHKGPEKSIGSKYKVSSFESSRVSNRVNYIQSSSSYFESSSTRPNSTESEKIYLQSSTPLLPSELERTVKNNQNPPSKTTKSTASSLGSILVLKSEMSLCSTISNKIMNTVSLTSVMNSSITSTSTHYSSYQSTDDPRSSSSLDELSTSDDLIDHPSTIRERKKLWNIGAEIPKREYTILRVSQSRLDHGNNEVRTKVLSSEEDPIVLMNNLPSKLDVSKIMNEIMSKKRFADASSIFIIVTMSEDEEEQASSHCIDSMTSIHSSETETILKDQVSDQVSQEVDPILALRQHLFSKRDDLICKKGKKFYMEKISSSDTETMFQTQAVRAQISRPNETAEMLEKAVHAIGTDTATNIPCCCCPKEYPNPFAVENCTSNEHYTANVTSRRKRSLSPPGRSPRCGLLPDMQIPSAGSSGLPCAAPTQPSVGSPHKTTGHYRLPDMSSAVSSIRQCEVPSASGVDWSSPSLSETFGCYCSPTSTESARLLSDLPTSSDGHVSLDDSLRVPDRVRHNMHYSRTETTTLQRNRRELLSHTIKTRLNASSNKLETTFKTDPEEVAYPIAFENPNRTGPIQRRANQQSYMSIDSPDEEDCLCEDIEGTDIIPDKILIRKPRIQESFKAKLPLDSTDEEDYVCEGTSIISFKQVSRKSEMLKDSADEGYCICEDTDTSDIITDKISNQQPRLQGSGKRSKKPMDPADGDIEDTNETPSRQPQTQGNWKSKKLNNSAIVDDFENKSITVSKMGIKHPRPQTNSKSKMPVDSNYEEYCLCDVTEGIDIITIKILSRKSKILIYSTDEEDWLSEEIEGTDIITDNMSSQEPQLQASEKSKMPINPTNGDHCLCEDKENPNSISDEISNIRPRLQASRKPKIPKHFTDEENCPCENIESSEIITVKISSLKRRLQASWESKMPMISANEEYCICQEIKGIDTRTDQISSRKPRLLESRNSEISIYSTDEDDCLCEEIECTDKMPSQEPQLQASGKSKMPINPADGDHCLCEDIEGTNKRSTQQPRFQVSQKSIKLKNSTVRKDYEIQEQSKNLTIRDCECQQPSKDSVTKVNCKCLRQSKDFTIKANCECQQKSLSTIKEKNISYQQQSKVLANNGFCGCEEIAAINRLCITGQSQQQPRATTNSTKINKFITSIKKSISHKIYQTRKYKSKNLKAGKKNKKPQSNRSIQTTPEHVLHSQQIPPDAASELEFVNDEYPYENNYRWKDFEELMKLRSELTEITSGFKACKMRNQRLRTEETISEKPNSEIELDFEDAIKYYVGKNLDQFRDLIPPIQSLQKTAQEANKKANKTKFSSEDSEAYKNIDNFFTAKDCCECSYGPLEISYKSITLTTGASEELSKRFPKGLKFSLGGLGLQPALGGVGGPGAARKPDRTGAGA